MHLPQTSIRLIIFILTLLLLNTASQAEGVDKTPRLSLTGIGDIKAAPDMAHVTTGVIVQAGTAKEALAQNSKKMASVFGMITKAGIDKKDIQTTNFNVGPRYKYSKDGTPPKIIGYQVTNQVTIAVRDLKKLGSLLDQVSQVGANKTGGIRFGHSNLRALQDKARAEAVKDALRKAKIYTEGTATKLGAIRSISENVHSPLPRRMAMDSAAKIARSVPIASGENSIRAQVHIVWEIE